MENQEITVSTEEVNEFIARNPLLKDWLRKYPESTWSKYAYEITRYFKWFREVKDWNVTPQELIDDHIRSRKAESVVERKKHLRLAKEYAYENPQFSHYGDSGRANIISAISSFYNYCEAPLTTAKGEFKTAKFQKHEYKQFGVEGARKIIDSSPQREKTMFLMMLQAGLRIGDLLNYVNYRWEEIKPQLEAGKDPIKINMYKKYWTYITTDAIHELKKYIQERGEPKPGEPTFVSASGKPLYPQHVARVFRRSAKKADLLDFEPDERKRRGKHDYGHRYPIRLHMFRKLFKSEASVAGRGIDQRYVEFFMGHAGGLAKVGGIYDKSPELHEPIFEAEYRKIAPYVNIYTGVSAVPIKEPTDEEVLNALKNASSEQREAMWATMRAFLPVKRLRKLDPEVAKLLGEIIEQQTASNSGNCANGHNCQRIVSEEELPTLLVQGWHVAAVLPSGKVVVSSG